MEIGLFGGTFNPPHLGHLIMAEEARVKGGLDEVWFLPTYLPPHKDRPVTPAHDRIEMVKLAINTNPYFKLSLIEMERKGRSFTYETLSALKEQHPSDTFYFIIGGDMVLDLPNWHRADELKQEVKFIGLTRPGFSVEDVGGFDVSLIDMPGIEISSTMIRERIKKDLPFRYYVLEKVRIYIEENKLYDS